MCAFLVLLSSTAHAATRAVVPRISFNGTTASCTVFVAADRPTDDIEAVIKLWQGSKCIETWEASSVGDLAFSGTATVSRGKTYQLTVDVTLEGTAKIFCRRNLSIIRCITVIEQICGDIFFIGKELIPMFSFLMTGFR